MAEQDYVLRDIGVNRRCPNANDVAPQRDPELQPIADRLRAAREQVGLSQVALAERAGISLAHLNRLENARREPGIKAIIRIARALNTTVSDLLRGVD